MAYTYEDFERVYQPTDDDNVLTVRGIASEFEREQPIFTENVNDNALMIHYPSLDGVFYSYETDAKTSPTKLFFRKRLPEPKNDFKYFQPRGTNALPFFPKLIIEAFHAKKTIKTLFVTEGEKKAYALTKNGVFAVGVGGINSIKRDKETNRFHEDLERLIITCQVQTIVFLMDGDIFDINFEKGKDLYNRPASFYNAVCTFRLCCEPLFQDEKVALSKVRLMFVNAEKTKQKGVDDLIFSLEEKERENFIKEIEKTKINSLLGFHDLTFANFQKLREFFGLKNPGDFYKKYVRFIGLEEFVFRRKLFIWNGEEVDLVRHQDSEQYMRVGANYFKRVEIPNKHKDLETHVVNWKKDEIKQDYKYYPDFVDWIKKYNAFCNVPENDPTAYEREHFSCYNIFEPLKHEIQPYDSTIYIKNTIDFLKHIFGGSASAESDITGDIFTVALDYLTLLYQRPQQILPIPCLVSPENSTGKSTFLKWLRLIWGENATIIGNEQFSMSFNSHYITKYIIGIDESFIEVDKKKEKERLKKLATDDRQFLQFKGKDVQEIDFFSKIILCSNDEKRIMKIDEGEIRWLIVRVPVIPQDKKDPELIEKLKREIPAFLGYLKNRKVHHKNEERHWFNSKHLITEQLKEVVRETKDYNQKAVDDVVRECFIEYDISEFVAAADQIKKEIDDHGKYKVEKRNVREYLQEKMGLKPSKGTVKSSFPYGYKTDASGAESINYLSKSCKGYTFHISDWLTADEIEMYQSAETPKDPLKLSGKDDLPF
jgi:hypothetical protein